MWTHICVYQKLNMFVFPLVKVTAHEDEGGGVTDQGMDQRPEPPQNQNQAAESVVIAQVFKEK